MPIPALSSPLLDQYNQNRQVTPALQSALDLARKKLTPAPGPLPMPPELSTRPTPAIGDLPSSVVGGQPAPPALTQPRAAVRPLAPTPLENAQENYARVTKAPLASRNLDSTPNPLAHTKADTGLSGIDQIHHAGLRIPLKILAGLGDAFLPALTMNLPGTQLHHDLVVHNAAGNVAEQESQANEASKRALEEKQGENLGAETALHNKQAQVAGTKPTDEWVESSQLGIDPDNPELGPQIVQFNKNTAEHRYSGVKAGAKPMDREPKEGELPLGDRVGQLNKALESRYQVLHPGQKLPAQYAIPGNSTQKDFDRIDRLMESEERATGTKAQQDTANEMRRQTVALASGNREHKQDFGLKTAAMKAYTPALESAERFNVMSENYERAVKDHDQQAMLSLLANHLGMTMGLQKGSRLTRDIIREAEQSRPWLQGMAAKFDKDGYLSGINLSPVQMRQMVDLGRSRFREDISKARNESKYQGVTDNGPDRTPGASTINHYLGLAGGDAKKAKQLAAEDGWTVE